MGPLEILQIDTPREFFGGAYASQHCLALRISGPPLHAMLPAEAMHTREAREPTTSHAKSCADGPACRAGAFLRRCSPNPRYLGAESLVAAPEADETARSQPVDLPAECLARLSSPGKDEFLPTARDAVLCSLARPL